MKRIALLAALGTIALAGCATGGDPAALAERECGNFARVEGARLIGVDGVDTVTEGDANFKVKMQVEDAMSRRTRADCLYSSANKQARWAAPLPTGFQRI
jgi:hypothetical protein